LPFVNVIETKWLSVSAIMSKWLKAGVFGAVDLSTVMAPLKKLKFVLRARVVFCVRVIVPPATLKKSTL
jgi:hypothetical protein